jgi:hypothetical protein
MRVVLATLMTVALLVTGCREEEQALDTRVEEWRVVLHAKRAASMSSSNPDRQKYADELLRFVQRHPDHPRAREVYDGLQQTMARELAATGDYAAAVRYYDNLIRRRPGDLALKSERDALIDRQSVDLSELASVKSGATTEEVLKVLGAPPAGWKKRVRRAGHDYESWYYRNDRGGVAAVHFDNGKTFATDLSTRRDASQ